MIIDTAVAADAERIAALVNASYRGARAERGWTHEAGLLTGQRTNASMVRGLIEEPGGTVLLLCEAAGEPPIGCVALAPVTPPTHWSLGMLTIDPEQQAGGLGRRLIEAAEDHARRRGAARIEMTVIASRAPLIAWYERRGYCLTGETRPFPYEDERFGQPLRGDIHFVVLEKALGETEPMP